MEPACDVRCVVAERYRQRGIYVRAIDYRAELSKRSDRLRRWVSEEIVPSDGNNRRARPRSPDKGWSRGVCAGTARYGVKRICETGPVCAIVANGADVYGGAYSSIS